MNLNNVGGPPARSEVPVRNVTPRGWSVFGGPPLFYTVAPGKPSASADKERDAHSARL